MSAENHVFYNTEDEVAQLLKSIADENGLKDYKIKKASGSMKGDGYMGVITAVDIYDDSDSEVINLVVKSAIKDEAFRKEVPISTLYQRETYMYNTFIPTLQEFLTDKGQPTLSCFPKCYKASLTTNSETLILENLRSKGFKLWERRTPMNDEHVAFVMETLGRYHALSLALKDQDPLRFKVLTENMTNTMAELMNTDEFDKMMVNESMKLVDILSSSEDADTIEKFKGFTDTAVEFLLSLLKLPEDYAVIVHGDPWTNNMFFKYDDVNNKNTPTEVCFIDLQNSRLASPILDLTYFFYICSSKNVLDNSQHYLDLYYNSLKNNLNQLGTNEDNVYPYAIFMQQWKELAKFGLLQSIFIIRLMLSEQDQVVDFSEVVASGKNVLDAFNYSVSNSTEYNERLINIAKHFVKNGLL